MAFKDGILEGVRYDEARHIGHAITPSLVVLHDTASSLKQFSAANYLRDNDAQTSVHFVVELDGTVTQQVPIDRRANHAGRSVYHGRKWCNGFSIGIELVNPGKMDARGANAVTWYGEVFGPDGDHAFARAETPEHGSGVWMYYPEAQLEAVIGLLRDLFGALDTLTDIQPHWYISPGRKVDTNPLFPLEHIRALVLGRDDPEDSAFDTLAEECSGDQCVQVNTPGDTLNMRRWPSFNPNTIASIPHSTAVPVLMQGTFEDREWLKVLYGGREGWIVRRYTNPVNF